MQALVENKVWTEAELMALPDDGRKYELVEGEIVVSNAGPLAVGAAETQSTNSLAHV